MFKPPPRERDLNTLSTAGSKETTKWGKAKAKLGYIVDMFVEQSAQSGGVALTGKTDPIPQKK